MRQFTLALALCCAAFNASAYDADFSIDCSVVNPTCQSDFRSISRDITAALDYKALGPAESTGITGIGIGAIATYVSVDSEAAWQNVTGEDVSAIGMAGAVLRKGLPFGLDLGAFYAAVPGADVSVYGGEVRWAILGGGIAEPALAVRGAFTRTSGIDDFDFDAYSLDASISKGNGGLEKEEIDAEKFFVGLRFGLALLDITPEYENIDGRDVYNLLIGLSF